MPLQVNLLKTTDDEEEEKKASESTVSVTLKNNGSSSSSSASSSSDDDEQEIAEAEPVPEPEEPEEEAPAPPPIVKPSQKKVEAEAAAAAKRPKARELTSVEKILYAKWFDGDSPTEVETVAQIFRLGEVDPERAQQAYDIYNQLKTAGQFKETYGAGNSDWIAKMNELGIEKTENLSQADLDYLYGYVRENGTVTASGSLSNANKYGAASVAAYNVNEFLKDYEATQGLLAEQNELFKELSYWVANGYTNDEIKGKINLSKYNGLYAAQEKTKNGQYTPTTSAIPALTSYGIDGMLFAIRNPNDSKNDYFLDAVQGQLGRGVQHNATPEQIARRTPGDPAWAPYATSGTMHDEAILFGVTGFDRKWLDDNYARIANSGDQELINAYGRVAEGVERTEKAQQEAAALRKTVDSMIASGMSADRIFTDDLLEEYPTLKAMHEGQQKLKLVGTTSPVDFDLYALRNEAEKAYKDVEGTVPGKDYAQRLETNLGASTPSYEGDAALDKEDEENLRLSQEIMYFESTPHEQDAAKSSKPNYYRVLASAASGVSAGTGGTKEAYNSAITAVNDYAGAHYLTAVGALAEAQQHLNDLKDAAKPMDDFLEKWFPEQDKGEVAEGLVNGDIATPDDPEFQKEFGEMKRHLGDYQTYLTNLTEAEGAVANEQRIIDNIAAQYEAAEELNTTGAPSQSVMPMLNYISAYTNYNAKQEYSSFGDWQYDVEIHDVPWSEANELLGKRKENNQKDLEYLDTAIEYAENHHADEQTLTNMRRTRDVIEADNRSIDYAQLQNADGFEAAVEQFDKEQEVARSMFDSDNAVRNAIIEFTQMSAQGVPDDAYPSLSSAGENLAIKIAAMTENERDTYKYLYETPEYGPEAASEYFAFIDDYYLTNRAMSYRQMVADEMTKEHPILMNAASIAGSPMQALGLVEVVESVLTGGEIDPNSEWFTVAKVVGEVRDTSTDMIVEHFGEGTTAAKVATFGYQTITSVGDSLAAAPVGGAFTMGVVTFANTAMEATENGGGKWGVLLLSGINALAEVGTEYIPMKGLEDAFTAGGKTGLKNYLADLMKSAASGLTEAPGEALSELISGAADIIIMDELSAYGQNVAQYGEKKAAEIFWKNVGMAGLQGFASGGVQNTVAYVAGSALSNKPQQARPVMEEQTAAPVIEEAPAPTEETAVAQEEAPEPGGGLPAEAMAEQNAAPEITPEPEKAKNTRMVAALATAQQDGISLSDRTATVNGVLEAGGLEPGLALAFAKEVAKDIPGLQQLQQSIQKMTTGDTATALKAAAYRMFAPPANADTMSDADVVAAVESDPKLSGAVENAVLNSDIATETMNVLKAMDKKAVENATTSQQNAKRAMNSAATEMGTKNAAAGAAFRALQSANEALKQNPADPKAASKAVEAAKQHQLKKAEAEEARRRYEASKQTFLDANKALQKEKQKASNEARRIAKETVMQRRAEQMEAAQQQKEAEAQRVTEQNAAMEQKAAEQAAVAEQSVPVEETTVAETPVAHTSALNEADPTLTMKPNPAAPAAPSAPATAPNIPAPPPGMGITQFAGKTAPKSKAVSDRALKVLHENPYYTKTTQKENVDKAIEAINNEGYERRKNKMLDGSTDIMTPAGQAELVVLQTVAQDMNDADGEAALVLRADDSGTTLGQALAMRKLYVQMTPEGKAQYVNRIIDKLNANNKGEPITAPEWLTERLRQANGNEKATNEVLDDVYRDIASQIRPSLRDYMNTWRYLAMLGNPLTWSKNFVGNIAFAPYVMVKNKTAAAIEARVQKSKAKKGRTFERTKSLTPVQQKYTDIAKEIYSEYESVLRGDPVTAQEKINDWRHKSWSWVDKLSRGNTKIMSATDMAFKKRYFQQTLASYLQANNVNPENPDSKVLAKATQYAYEEALKNTFNNANSFAEWLNAAQRDARRRGGYIKLADPIISAIQPFTKVPANVVMRGVEYSPIGLLNSLTANTIKLKRGKDSNGNPYTLNQWIDSVSAGLTGTLATGLGAFLASIGTLELGDDEDDEVRGIQKNSINILGHSVAIDSLGTAAMPLLVGAQMYELFTAEKAEYMKDGFQLRDTPDALAQLLTALGGIADPVMELSFMQGFKSLMTTAAYSDQWFLALGERVATSYVSSLVPSVFGAIARTIDDTRRTTYVDKNSVLDSQTQNFIQTIRNKIPGLSKEGAAKLDAWGDEVKTDDVLMRFLSNFLIPGYPQKQVEDDEVTLRLLQLFDDTSEEGFLPKSGSTSFSANRKKYYMTAEEYAKREELRGDIAHDAFERLLQMDEFNSADAPYKLVAAMKVYDYATQKANYAINNWYKVDAGIASTDDPVAFALEKMNESIEKGEILEYSQGIIDAVAVGDLDSAEMCVEALRQRGKKNSTIKNDAAKTFKPMYRDMLDAGDEEGMRELRNTLLDLGIGYTYNDFDKWLE